MKKQVNIISHTHWDREWYMSWEKHRMRLVRFMDDLIDLLESDPDFKCFHLDGQTVVLQDYYEIRPSNRERVLKLIREKRLFVGPWYVLQDEFLISGEANIRNLIVGLRDCEELGAEPVMLGYLPDAFGNISQMPQILAGFQIEYAAFGRGLTEVGADNRVMAQSCVRNSELVWESPDGSKVLAVLFVNWYNNAMELSEDRACFDRLIAGCEKFAGTPYLLAMNGCDHQPVQKNLSTVLDYARREYPDYEFVHTDFMTYMRKLKEDRREYPVYRGEITGQYTRGFVTFTNTASSRVEVKQRNFAVTRSLERLCEPICTMAQSLAPYPAEILRYSWKTLLQNYAHDSICCCNSDELLTDMAARYNRAEDSANAQTAIAVKAISSAVDTTGSVFNVVLFTTDFARGVTEVFVNVDLEEGREAEDWTLFDGDAELPCIVKRVGRTFTYELPDDRFRIPKYVNRYELSFCVYLDGKAGYRTLRLEPRKQKTRPAKEAREGENEYLKVRVEENGTLSVTVKETGRTYRGLNLYTDEGEIGEGYTHYETDDRKRDTTACDRAEISMRRLPYMTEWTVVNHIQIPVRREGRNRSAETKTHVLRTKYRLLDGTARVEIHTEFENSTEDHRLRAAFPFGFDCASVTADGQFDLVERSVQTTSVWENPSNDQRMLAFVKAQNGADCLLVAARGLHEYEALRDGSNTLNLTLLRAFGEMGDWGYFPTPAAQCKGAHTFDYALVFGGDCDRAADEAVVFAYRPCLAVTTGEHRGVLPAVGTAFDVEGKGLRFSAFKLAEDGKSDLLRIYNPTDGEREFLLRAPDYGFVAHCRLDETLSEEVVPLTIYRETIPPKKIMTYRLYRK